MPLVRLQCPACESIVKISEEIAAQHPLVRCAKCQGLVTVAASRVIEPVASADEGDESSYKPRKKKKKSKGDTAPVGMIVGIVVGLLVLAGAGVSVYLLITHIGGSPLEKSFKKAIALMEQMADAVDSIQTPQDVPKAFDQMNGAFAELKQMEDENRLLGVHPEAVETQRLSGKYTPEFFKLAGRIEAAMMKLRANPAIAQALKENLTKLGPALSELAQLGGGLSIPGAHKQLDFGNNLPQDNLNRNPANQGSGSSTSNALLQQLENALISKNIQAKFIPEILEKIRDTETADLAMFQLDAVLKSLAENESTIRRLEREQGKPTTAAALQTLREIEKTKDELAVHLTRIEKLPDLRSVHEKIVKKLSEVGLASETASTASNQSPGKEGSNPVEPAGNGGKTMPASGRSSSLEATLAKLTSTDHFKKQEGIREAQVAKFEEASKAAVLEALLTLSVDSDVHQKSEVLKAYKKWAMTQEDKERLGEHAESLLKDPFVKKDALRYFGENKIISSSKEVALLLKDNFDRKDAAEALIAMGSGAESSVIPHLTDLEPQVRQLAIEVLARIGTPVCVPELQKLKADRFVGRAASQAITLINSRKK